MIKMEVPVLSLFLKNLDGEISTDTYEIIHSAMETLNKKGITLTPKVVRILIETVLGGENTSLRLIENLLSSFLPSVECNITPEMIKSLLMPQDVTTTTTSVVEKTCELKTASEIVLKGILIGLIKMNTSDKFNRLIREITNILYADDLEKSRVLSSEQRIILQYQLDTLTEIQDEKLVKIIEQYKKLLN